MMDDRYNPGSSPFSGMPASAATTIRPAIVEPSSPEDDSNIKDDMEMDMKILMGDAVGNVSSTRPPPRDVSVLSMNIGVSGR